MVGARALDDRVRLSHAAMVSALTGRDFRIGVIRDRVEPAARQGQGSLRQRATPPSAAINASLCSHTTKASASGASAYATASRPVL